MSQKTEKNVPSAETQKPKQSNEKPSPLESLIPPKVLKTAKKWGVDLTPILAWAGSVEQRMNNTEKAIELMAQEMPKATAQALMKMAQEQRQKQIAEAQASGATTGRSVGGLGDIVAIGKALGVTGGGGGMDEEMMNLNKELMKASVDRIKQDILLGAKRADADISLAEAIKGLVIKKVAEKTVVDILK